jgi:hypothetical protein
MLHIKLFWLVFCLFRFNRNIKTLCFGIGAKQPKKTFFSDSAETSFGSSFGCFEGHRFGSIMLLSFPFTTATGNKNDNYFFPFQYYRVNVISITKRLKTVIKQLNQLKQSILTTTGTYSPVGCTGTSQHLGS